MNESELSAMAEKLTIMGEYSEAELRRRLANEEDIVTFMATICWFVTNTRERERLSPFEEMVWGRIVIGTAHYWDPKALGCPL